MDPVDPYNNNKVEKIKCFHPYSFASSHPPPPPATSRQESITSLP
jgi:hypothetical protein